MFKSALTLRNCRRIKCKTPYTDTHFFFTLHNMCTNRQECTNIWNFLYATKYWGGIWSDVFIFVFVRFVRPSHAQKNAVIYRRPLIAFSPVSTCDLMLSKLYVYRTAVRLWCISTAVPIALELSRDIRFTPLRRGEQPSRSTFIYAYTFFVSHCTCPYGYIFFFSKLLSIHCAG